MPLLSSRLRPTSLKARIALAFVILILTSATCTIVIGNAIFARKANELARARLELDLRVVGQVMSARQELLRMLAAPVAAELERNEGRLDERVCQRAAQGERAFDFVALLEPAAARAVVFDARRCTGVTLSGAPLQALLQPDLGRLAATLVDGTTAAGLVVVEARTLCWVAARRLGGGGVLVLGSRLEGQLEALAQTLGLRPGDGGPRHQASLYLGDARVATTLGPRALGSRPAPEVVQAVLREGRVFAGPAEVAGVGMGSAYMPLRDFRGAVVGMLGIGTTEDVYGEIWRRTALLFSTIIAGGMTFGFLMAWFFSVTLTRPLTELADGMAHVADGDLDLKIRDESRDELGQLRHAFNVMVRGVKERDLRLREATSEKLSQVEKQVSVGRLAAGVAHEINNPMTAILSLSMLLRKSLDEHDPRREDLDVVITETRRCRDIVRRLLDFAQERPPEKRIVDVNDIMRETLALTSRYEALGEMQVEVRLAAEPLLVDADAKQMQQVFTNVVLNAAEAMQKGGTIRVSSAADVSGGFVAVRVADTGKGIPRECLPRVFEPFFTTKGTTKGTGLGLSVSLGIVRKHDGAIDIESEEDRGTTVTITIPRAEATQPPGADAAHLRVADTTRPAVADGTQPPVADAEPAGRGGER